MGNCCGTRLNDDVDKKRRAVSSGKQRPRSSSAGRGSSYQGGGLRSSADLVSGHFPIEAPERRKRNSASREFQNREEDGDEDDEENDFAQTYHRI